MPSIDLAALRAAVQESHYFITTHAKQRMGLRNVTGCTYKAGCLREGQVVEDYPNNRPDRNVLLMAFIKDEPLYVSCAFDGSYAYIITVHRYDSNKWIDPWTRREE